MVRQTISSCSETGFHDETLNPDGTEAEWPKADVLAHPHGDARQFGGEGIDLDALNARLSEDFDPPTVVVTTRDAPW